MKGFKPMPKNEYDNWKKATILGFYTYMILLFINLVSELGFSRDFLSTGIVFLSGLAVAFAYQLILNLKDKKQSNDKKIFSDVMFT